MPAMDIRNTRRLIARRLDAAIDALQELRGDVRSYEKNDTWLSDGLEDVLGSLGQLMAFADGGDIEDTIDDGADDAGDEEELQDDGDAGLDELDFSDEDYGIDEDG